MIFLSKREYNQKKMIKLLYINFTHKPQIDTTSL